MTSGPVPALRPLWRPVGPEELALIEASGWRRFPPSLPEQPIFYPVCNEAYATQIARDWNVKASGAGFVLAFDVEEAWAARYPIRRVGGDFIGDDSGFHVVAVGEAEMLIRRDVA